MKKVQLLMIAAWLLVPLLVSCAPQSTPAPASPPAPAVAPVRPAAAAVTASPARPAWQVEWENTLAAARQEGRLIMRTTAGGGILDALRKVAKMQGLQAEVMSLRSTEFLPKILAERRAGLYLNDVSVSGSGTVVNQAKPAGVLEPLDSALILPDVTDPEKIKQVWYRGKLPWVDKEHMILLTALQPGTAITVNTNLVKPDEVKSWRDVLNPKWEGKVAYNDPTVGGYGSLCVQAMAKLVGEDYVRDLVKAKPIIIRDQRQLIEWLAHGKIAIAIAAPVEVIVEFIQAGAPIKPVVPQEGTWLGPGNAGTLVWFKNMPHPNASKVFINTLLSKEGQDVLAVAGGINSTREDASTAHLLPGLARTAGGKYFDASTEEAVLERAAVTDKWGRELFGPLVK